MTVNDHHLVIGGRSIEYINTQEALPNWGDLGVKLVIDCTGRATNRAGAQAHLDKGAQYVLVSAASKTAKDADAFLLLGINADQFAPNKDHIVSMASCTTNAMAPVVKVLREKFGLKEGFFSTVHAYTNTQSLTDQPMRDRRELVGGGGERDPVFVWRSQSTQVHLARPERNRQSLPRARPHRQHR